MVAAVRTPRGVVPLLAAVTLSLAGCAQPPAGGNAVASTPVTPDAGVAVPQQWLREPGAAFVLDPASRITLRVYRAGRLAHLGHNHVIEAVDLDGRLWGLDHGGGLADLRLRVNRLRVDDPAARTAAGEAFATASVIAVRRELLICSVVRASGGMVS